MKDNSTVKGLNIEKVRTALHLAALLDVPEFAKELNLIKELWPTLHQLRMRGLSFSQISNVLRQQNVRISATELQCMNAEILCEVYEGKIAEISECCASHLGFVEDDPIS